LYIGRLASVKIIDILLDVYDRYNPQYKLVLSGKCVDNEIQQSRILDHLGLRQNEYFVVSAHREENINSENNFLNLIDNLNSIAEIYKLPIIFSTHPRTRKMIEAENIQLNPLIRTEKPFGFIDYIKLQMNAKAVLSDSGTISEETSILKLKALNTHEAHERPGAMEEATVMMVGTEERMDASRTKNIRSTKQRNNKTC